ncbi:MAG: hypothetical protein ACRDTP_07255 [Mycobacteriales bacterium]
MRSSARTRYRPIRAGLGPAARRKTRPFVPAALAACALVAGCGGGNATPADPGSASTSGGIPRAQVAAPHGVEVSPGSTPQQIAAAVSSDLFVSAPVAVVVGPGDPAAVHAAATAATEIGAPLLLGDAPPPTPSATAPSTTPASPRPAAGPAATEVQRLRAGHVLLVGAVGGPAGGKLGGATVVRAQGVGSAAVAQAVATLPTIGRPIPLRDTTVLVRTGGASGAETEAAPVAAATATVAGATVVPVAADDPRSDSKAVTALARRPAGPVLAAGPGFGPVATLTRRLTVARTGVQLPGGGQVMFPGRALVALYGHPGNTALGVLGDQDAAASVARAQQVAAPYAGLYHVPVIPTFEIIAAVASGSAGADGDYSNEFSPASLLPFVDAITRAGGYVVLDLQPGRANVLDQAKMYAPLLKRPNVGLALDAEWALRPGQQPLHQIGSLDASQINAVFDWLSAFTAAAHLPQKVLVLHQFRLTMLGHEAALETGNDQVAVLIHADGQGSRPDKEATWRGVIGAAPPGVWFGWKNFYKQDPQMASPTATVARKPQPVMVSYQ